MDLVGQFWHHVAMGGIGADRRAHHRASLADAVRKLRTQRGWSQEELAERLEIDRRQVVRLESREVPMTLEVIEALASAFGVPSIYLMFSVRDENRDLDFGSNWFRRMAGEEIRRVFGSSVSRSGVSLIARTVALLSDEHIVVVGQVADAMLKAQAVTDREMDEYMPLGDSLLAGGKIGKGIAVGRRARTTNKQVASRRSTARTRPNGLETPPRVDELDGHSGPTQAKQGGPGVTTPQRRNRADPSPDRG